MNESTDLEIVLTLAEFIGWQWWKHTKSATYIFGHPDRSKDSLDDNQMQWEKCQRPAELPKSFSTPPNCVESLDACFLVEDRLDLKQMDSYATNLWQRTHLYPKESSSLRANLNMYIFVHASSRQRAISLYEILQPQLPAVKG